MSVRVAPPSVARGGGAMHTERYEALKRELEEFINKGPQVRLTTLICAFYLGTAAAGPGPGWQRAPTHPGRVRRGRYTHVVPARTRVSCLSTREPTTQGHAAAVNFPRPQYASQKTKSDCIPEFSQPSSHNSQHDAATPLHHAAEEGDVPAIKALLKIGAQVDEKDSEGQTPLMVAASWGQPDSIRALVEGGADTSLQDEGGDTALHEAARADEVESLMALLDLGVDKDPRNKLGATPLHLASHVGNKAACKALIRGGAAVSGEKSLMKGGYSPLHAAAANGSMECLQDLIDAGSSLRHSASETSLRGGSATALELAEESGQQRTASMLRNASVSEFENFGMWGKPESDGGGGSSGG